MLTAILAIIAVRQTWDLPLLTPLFFPVPTGMNGAEEYAMAMDVLRKGQFQAYSDWQEPELRLPGGSKASRMSWDQNPPDPHYLALLDRLDTLNVLAVRTEEHDKFQRATDLVAEGNSKDLIFPDMVGGSRFPPVSDTIFLGRLGAASAYVNMSNGRSDAATLDLGTMLVMVQRTSAANYMNTLVGTLDSAILLQSFAGNLDRFSLPDTAQLEDLANHLLSQPPGFIAAFRRDLKNALDRVGQRVSDLFAQKANPNDKLAGEAQAILRGTSEEQMTQAIRSDIQANGDIALKRFDGPEANWLPEEDTTNPDLTLTTPKTADDVEALLAQTWSPPAAQNANSILRDMQSRAQIRLLRLSARIVAFRWNWERLPKTLDEMNLPADYIFDPLSKQPFVYEPKGITFQLYSKGWKSRGRVDFFSIPSVSRQQAVHP